MTGTERIHNEKLASGPQAVREERCDMLVLGEVVMTGHAPVPELLILAGDVTRMQKERHPYDSTVAARYGVEY